MEAKVTHNKTHTADRAAHTRSTEAHQTSPEACVFRHLSLILLQKSIHLASYPTIHLLLSDEHKYKCRDRIQDG